MSVDLPSSIAPKTPGASPVVSDDAHNEAALNGFLELLSAYLPADDVQKVAEAYRFGAAAHEGQYRISGEPYISHPLAVATRLASWHLDSQAIIAALLHDVMEDTAISGAEIAERFGKTAAELVDGVSKLDRIENQTYEEA